MIEYLKISTIKRVIMDSSGGLSIEKNFETLGINISTHTMYD